MTVVSRCLSVVSIVSLCPCVTACVSLCSSVSPRGHTLQKKIHRSVGTEKEKGKTLFRPGLVSIFRPTISNHVKWRRNGTPACMNQGEHHSLNICASIHRDLIDNFSGIARTRPARPSLQHRTATTTASKRRTTAPLKTRPPCASVPLPTGHRFNFVTSSRPPHCWTSRSNKSRAGRTNTTLCPGLGSAPEATGAFVSRSSSGVPSLKAQNIATFLQ